LRVYHLPGHAPGHLAFQETRYQAVIVGDLISTLSSMLIDPTDGHLGTYIESLQFLESVTNGHLYPAHGPPAREGRRVVQKALDHRHKRKQQIIATLGTHPQTLEKLVNDIYAKFDQAGPARFTLEPHSTYRRGRGRGSGRRLQTQRANAR
jgi:glyoxylase-like metal-dependent hydrolase (beta-lactamase superfamily II)